MVTLTVESWSVAGSPRNSLASVGTMSPKFVFLLLTAIQEISAEVGPETSGEAGGVLCTLYPLPCTLYPVLYIVCKLTLQSWKGGLRGDLSWGLMSVSPVCSGRGGRSRRWTARSCWTPPSASTATPPPTASQGSAVTSRATISLAGRRTCWVSVTPSQAAEMSSPRIRWDESSPSVCWASWCPWSASSSSDCLPPPAAGRSCVSASALSPSSAAVSPSCPGWGSSPPRGSPGCPGSSWSPARPPPTWTSTRSRPAPVRSRQAPTCSTQTLAQSSPQTSGRSIFFFLVQNWLKKL